MGNYHHRENYMTKVVVDGVYELGLGLMELLRISIRDCMNKRYLGGLILIVSSLIEVMKEFGQRNP